MRDDNLTRLRPHVLTDNTHATAIEKFQNETLRPILKLQHDLLVLMFKNYIVLHKNIFHTLSKLQKEAYIEQAVKQDMKFRNRLLGIVMGHFTEAEYLFFQENEAELVRRMSQLIVQRLQSVYHKF